MKALRFLKYLFGIIACGFIISGIAFEYAAIWVNQWAAPGEIGLLSDQLQASAALNLVLFVICMALAIITSGVESW